jgi:hypothetical protein
MKQLLIAFVLLFAAGLVGGVPASAATSGAYPPSSVTVTVSPANPTPGSTLTVTVKGCQPGESVVITLHGVTVTVTCEGGSGSAAAGFRARPAQTTPTGTATGQIAAPDTPGTYTGTVDLLTSGVTLTFEVTVRASGTGNLPSTGGGGVDTMVPIGVILLAAGIGLLAVVRLRRRRPASISAG